MEIPQLGLTARVESPAILSEIFLVDKTLAFKMLDLPEYEQLVRESQSPDSVIDALALLKSEKVREDGSEHLEPFLSKLPDWLVIEIIRQPALHSDIVLGFLRLYHMGGIHTVVGNRDVMFHAHSPKCPASVRQHLMGQLTTRNAKMLQKKQQEAPALIQFLHNMDSNKIGRASCRERV